MDETPSDLPQTNPEDENPYVDAPVDDGVPPPIYEKPSIEKAWQFYESCLPRRIKVAKGGTAGIGADGMFKFSGVGAQQSDKGTGYRLARPGETHDPVSGEPAVPYDVWNIFAFRELDEFGIGISLYFRQLLLLFFVIGVCACVNLMTIQYNVDYVNVRTASCPTTLLGSVYGTLRDDLTMANQGYADIATCVILFFFVVLLRRFENANIESIDLAQQTPQDYSIRVRNIPPNITDPDYYHKFFSENWGDVVFVTVALDNGPLLKVLAEGREMDEVIEAKRNSEAADVLQGKPVVKQSDLTPDQVSKQKFGMHVTMEYLLQKKGEIIARVAELARPNYKPVCVYVTFNSEASQRRCISECSTGIIEEVTGCSNNKGQIDGHVLKIDEPVEPSEIIYENFHLHWIWQYWGFFKAYFLTSMILLISFLILQSLSVSVSDDAVTTDADGGTSAYLAAFVVSLINGALPYTLKVITLKMEVHKDEGDVQTSILRKLMVARCLNTAVLMYVVTKHTAQFSKANLGQVQSILIADCFTTPVIRLLNIYEHVMHRVVAPTKKTQAQMNVLFRGAYWNLAERYTDMIKTLFVGLFYSTIIPSSLFITSFCMLFTYIVDRYCLLRMWERPPMYDEEMAVASRKMMIVCVWVHLLMAMVFFANWPYSDESIKPDCNIFSCNDVAGVWTDDQRDIVRTYSTCAILVFVFMLFYLIIKRIGGLAKCFFRSVDEVGEASNVEYRNLTGVSAYIPNLRRSSLINPLFAADISQIPSTYVPCRKLTLDGQPFDINELSLNSREDISTLQDAQERSLLFGCCKFYPPGLVVQPLQMQGKGLATRAAAQVGAGAVASQQVVLQMTAQAGAAVQQVQQQVMSPSQIAMHGQPRAAGVMPKNVHSGNPHRMPQNASGGNPYRQQQQQHQHQQQQVQNAKMQQIIANANNLQQQQFHQQQASQVPSHVMVAQAHPVLPSNPVHQSSLAPLPEGWETKVSPDGRPYYVNHNTQTTQWTRPVYRTAMDATAERRRGSSAGGGMPRGWEIKYTAQGRPYYVDHNTGTTSWNPPVIQQGV